MDELAFIRSFGSVEAPAPSWERERVRAALVAHIDRTSTLRFGRRRWVFALAAAATLLLAGTAFAWKGPLRGLFEGQPASPQVKQAIEQWNQTRDLTPGLGGLVFRSEDAVGLLRFRAGSVKMRVWEAPLVDGGACTFIETRDDHGPSVGPGPCAGPVNVQPPVVYGLSTVPGPAGFTLVAGHVTDAVARVELRLGSGRARKLKLAEGFFAGYFLLSDALKARESREADALIARQQRESRRRSLSPATLAAHRDAEWKALFARQKARRVAMRPVALVGYDGAGSRLATLPLPEEPPYGAITFPFAHFYEDMHALLQTNTSVGLPVAYVRREVNGELCDQTFFAGGAGLVCGGPHRERPDGVDVSIGWVGGSVAPDHWIAVGTAGEDVSALELRFAGGERRQLELLDGHFLADVTSADIGNGTYLVIRDSSGKVVGTQLLQQPWPAGAPRRPPHSG